MQREVPPSTLHSVKLGWKVSARLRTCFIFLLAVFLSSVTGISIERIVTPKSCYFLICLQGCDSGYLIVSPVVSTTFVHQKAT